MRRSRTSSASAEQIENDAAVLGCRRSQPRSQVVRPRLRLVERRHRALDLVEPGPASTFDEFRQAPRAPALDVAGARRHRRQDPSARSKSPDRPSTSPDAASPAWKTAAPGRRGRRRAFSCRRRRPARASARSPCGVFCRASISRRQPVADCRSRSLTRRTIPVLAPRPKGADPRAEVGDDPASRPAAVFAAGSSVVASADAPWRNEFHQILPDGLRSRSSCRNWRPRRARGRISFSRLSSSPNSCSIERRLSSTGSSRSRSLCCCARNSSTRVCRSPTSFRLCWICVTRSASDGTLRHRADGVFRIAADEIHRQRAFGIDLRLCQIPHARPHAAEP